MRIRRLENENLLAKLLLLFTIIHLRVYRELLSNVYE